MNSSCGTKSLRADSGEFLKDALDSVGIYRNSSLGMTMDGFSYTNISPGENFNAVGSD